MARPSPGSRTWWVATALFASVLPLGWADAAGARPERAYGDAVVLAQVPPPGFPEGIAVWGNKVIVAGPATFGTAGQGPSAVFAFNRSTGALARTWTTEGEDLSKEHANSGVAVDGRGRIYVLNIQTGIFRLMWNGRQEPYAQPFPNLPTCAAAPSGTACSPTPFDAPPLPNDIVFDEAGSAYVTDSMQATIWRVPPGGGEPEIWFQDARLASTFVGVNGIRIDPTGTVAYVTVTGDLDNRAWVYRLPLAETPGAADLTVFHEYTGEIPDGIAFGESGLLYVAIATPFASGVSVLDAAGVEVTRLANTSDSVFPYDSPANIAFDGKGSMLLTNHAFVTGVTDPSQFTVLDVFVGDRGAPLARPKIP
jgi:sugar lactone lactonase YvrE